MRWLFLAHTPIVGTAFRVGSHHLAEQLSAKGHVVVHCPPPQFKLRSRASLLLPPTTCTTLPSGVHEVKFTRWLLPELLRFSRPDSTVEKRVARPLARSLMDVFEGLGGPPDIVVVDKVHMRGVADLLPRRVLVFRPTDWFGFSPRSSRADAEHWLCRHADLIVSTSTVILDRYRSAGYELPSSSAVLANGVDLDTFKPSTATGPRNEKKAVYVGALDDRFDFDAVCAAADSRPDWSFDLYGPASERLTRTPRPGNVRLPGALPYAQVPNVLRDSTVGLLPLNQSEANEARSPMKYYEYRATGLPIVASRTAELESRTDPGLFLYDAHQHLADALDLAEKAGHSELPGIETHGWGTIIDRFEELVMQAAGE